MIVVATTMGAPSHQILDDWSVTVHESSGWGGSYGIKVDSQGHVDSLGHNLAFEGLSPLPKSDCEEMPLAAEQVREIKSQISGIPSDVLEHGGLYIQSTCSDDAHYWLVLTMNGLNYRFGYPQTSFCRDQQIPEWLISLVSVLWKRYEAIMDCRAKPADDTSHR